MRELPGANFIIAVSSLFLPRSGELPGSRLEDRFNSKVHRKTKKVPVFALVVAKEGGAEIFCLPPVSAPPPPSNPNDPSIFTAVEEQLGLTLESLKSVVEMVVIDHIERPSEYKRTGL